MKKKIHSIFLPATIERGLIYSLYYTPIRNVTYWEEVTLEELPIGVQQHYQNNKDLT